MLSLPIITAEVFWRRYLPVMLGSVAFSLVASVCGLFVSTVVDVPCSAIIVLIMVGMFIAARAVGLIISNRNKI